METGQSSPSWAQPLADPDAAADQPTPSGGAAPSFRRQRAPRACETCHARKVRCDAASLGMPCTNCVAFRLECKISQPRRRKGQGQRATSQTKDSDSDPELPTGRVPSFIAAAFVAEDDVSAAMSDSQVKSEDADSVSALLDMGDNPTLMRAPLTAAGRVAYLGESSNVTLLVQVDDGHPSTDVVHYPLPEIEGGPDAKLAGLDKTEMDILHQRGAFLLPPKALRDDLVHSYFTWVHPIVPVINRTRFMREYNDPKQQPSLLLLQTVLLAGSRACRNSQLLSASGSTNAAGLTYFKRAKALYDAHYENDRVTIVQSLLLMGWFWQGPEDVTKNVFYWTRLAINIAQGSGMHRSVEASQLSRSEKRLWKRVWWTLFTRDRSVAVAFGRPSQISLDDSDVELLTEDDFVEEASGGPIQADPVHVQFFLQYIKLCSIMSCVLEHSSYKPSVAASGGRTRQSMDLNLCDVSLADWLQNCPREVYWEASRHHFLAAILHSNYYSTLCLLHRAFLPPGAAFKAPGDPSFSSRRIIFQAAAMITSIAENLMAHDELRCCPAFMVHILFSALVMHTSQLRSPVPGIQTSSQDRLKTCLKALKQLSKVWPLGFMIVALFEVILGNKALETRLQGAGGKRHGKTEFGFTRVDQTQPSPTEAAKRKYDDMASSSYGQSRPPSAGLGAVRARPVTDSPPPSGHCLATGFPTAQTPPRPGPQPVAAFDLGCSVMPNAPDFCLFSGDSQTLTPGLLQNFQPDQLFPVGTNLFTGLSPPQSYDNLDPNLLVRMQATNMHPHPMAAGQLLQPGHLECSTPFDEAPIMYSNELLQPSTAGPGQVPVSPLWLDFTTQFHDGQSPESRSTGSGLSQAIPATLNVEDWYQFFGIHGADSSMSPFDLYVGSSPLT